MADRQQDDQDKFDLIIEKLAFMESAIFDVLDKRLNEFKSEIIAIFDKHVNSINERLDQHEKRITSLESRKQYKTEDMYTQNIRKIIIAIIVTSAITVSIFGITLLYLIMKG